ncbi:helix-turn-helix transcriptional regulator [Phenylobacterium sp.]|uniref:helix-turn-helix transcriptional regulator n=1 Tax=Phenylobacterium sp. TaxID=1871053 RepID=UPI00356949D7
MNAREVFLDELYEAAVDVTLWPRVLRRLADLAGGHDAVLRSYDLYTEAGPVVASRMDPSALAANFRAFATRNPLKTPLDQIAGRKWTPGYKRDIDWLPKEDFVGTEYYNDFYKKFDIHSDVSVGFESANACWTGVDIYRSEKQGAFTGDELALCMSLQPHMARAIRLSRATSDMAGVADGHAEIVDNSPTGLFVLERTGVVRHINAAGERLIAGAKGITVRKELLVCAAHADTQRLRAMICRAGDPDLRAGGSMGLAAPRGGRRIWIEVAPLAARHAWAFAAGPAVIVSITDQATGGHVPESMLRDLFDLTPAEIRVVASLFAGMEPSKAAEHLGVAMPTIRSHLVHIYAKTNTTGQSDLCRLLGRLTRD